MLKPFFVEKDKQPTGKSLAEALGGSYESFVELVRLTDSLIQDWKFYSPKYGWSLKVFQKKKVLFYLTPNAGQFSYGMALRESERDLILGSNISDELKVVLADEKKVMEGYPLRLEVQNNQQLTDINTVIGILNKERKVNL